MMDILESLRNNERDVIDDGGAHLGPNVPETVHALANPKVTPFARMCGGAYLLFDYPQGRITIQIEEDGKVSFVHWTEDRNDG